MVRWLTEIVFGIARCPERSMKEHEPRGQAIEQTVFFSRGNYCHSLPASRSRGTDARCIRRLHLCGSTKGGPHETVRAESSSRQSGAGLDKLRNAELSGPPWPGARNRKLLTRLTTQCIATFVRSWKRENSMLRQDGSSCECSSATVRDANATSNVPNSGRTVSGDARVSRLSPCFSLFCWAWHLRCSPRCS